MERDNIRLSEIDPTAIKMANIRVNLPEGEESARKALEKSIESEGQKEPISVRELTDAEKQTCAKGAKYGILDGHQRHEIVRALGKQDILARVEKHESRKADLIYATRMNLPQGKISSLDKGRILHILLQEIGEKQTKEMVGEIAKQVFNIGVALAYRYIGAWKKAQEDSPQSQEADSEPRPKKSPELPDFSDTALEHSWNGISERSNLKGYRDYAFQVDAISDLEKRLKAYKDFLLKSMAECPESEDELREWKSAKKEWDAIRPRLDELENLLATNPREADEDELKNLTDKEDYLLGILNPPPRKDAIGSIKFTVLDGEPLF